MTHHLNAEKTAAVANDVFWLPIDSTTPQGVKCLVIDKKQGIAYLREYWHMDGWTHWHPLPRFRHEPDPTYWATYDKEDDFK